jgi:ABC-type glycerol-3-phosphate transport system substrate-binding protein
VISLESATSVVWGHSALELVVDVSPDGPVGVWTLSDGRRFDHPRAVQPLVELLIAGEGRARASHRFSETALGRRMVYYNKEIFAANGITETPKTFDDMVTAARALKGKGVTPFFEMAGDRWATQWWVQVQLADAAKNGLWDKINTKQETFGSPVVLDAIKKYKSLIDEGLFNADIKTAKLEDQSAALLDGKAAMAVQVNSFFGQLQAKSDTATLDKKIGFFPIAPSGQVGTFIPDQSNALVAFRTGDTKRETAARQLLAYWMGPGYQEFVTDRNTVSLQPTVPNPAGVPKALLDVHAALPQAVGSMQALAVANPDLYINLADMIVGTMTPEEVAKSTQDQFAQLAKAAGAPGF